MTVHSGMVSHHSSALDTLVNGPMAEAKAGEATWDDVDTGTFARFSQWGYTRDYTSVLAERLPQVTAPVTNPLDPEPDFKPSDDAIEPSPVEHLDETRYSSLYLRRKGTKKRVALHPVDPM